MELPLPPRLIPGTSFCIVCKDVSNLSLHSFPKKPADHQRWLRVLHLPEEMLKQKPKPKVCAAHFHHTCFSKSATSVPRLLPGALPNRLPYNFEKDGGIPIISEAEKGNPIPVTRIRKFTSYTSTQVADEKNLLAGDPTLPILDECSIPFMISGADEAENISKTIFSTIPIMDEHSRLTIPTGIDVELPIIEECSSVSTFLV
ncbi:hypothetical protein Trydic_g16778 [Trypoxylus dichotomus]